MKEKLNELELFVGAFKESDKILTTCIKGNARDVEVTVASLLKYMLVNKVFDEETLKKMCSYALETYKEEI